MLDAQRGDNSGLLLSYLGEFGCEKILNALFRLIDDAVNFIFRQREIRSGIIYGVIEGRAFDISKERKSIVDSL